MKRDDLKLCLITHMQHTPFSRYKEFILQAIAGGVTLVQLREKSKSLSDVRELALGLKALLQPLNVPLIINDHLTIAKEIEADGIHLGQGDVSPVEARQLLGPDKIIGWSIESMTELEMANQLTCIDYIAASAVFPSQTKTDCKTIWGLSGLQKIVKKSRHPVVAIGGIDASNIQQIINKGACGAAVISAIHASPDPKRAALELITAMN